jgi:hypothetical protein
MNMYTNEVTIPYHDETVATKIAKTFDKFAGQPVTPTQVANHLRKIVGSTTVINVSKDASAEPNEIGLKAYYDPDEDEDEEKPFELVLYFNPNDKQVTMDLANWREFAAQVIEFLQHEVIHQHQYRSRDFIQQRPYRSNATDPDIRDRQEYQGNPDEVEAYSHNLASELLRKTRNDPEQVLRLLRNFSNTAMSKDQAGRFLSPTLYGYFQDFQFNTQHPVLKSLLKKTYQYVMIKKNQADKAKRVDNRNNQIQQATEEFNKRREMLDKQLGSSYTVIVDK